MSTENNTQTSGSIMNEHSTSTPEEQSIVNVRLENSNTQELIIEQLVEISNNSAQESTIENVSVETLSNDVQGSMINTQLEALVKITRKNEVRDKVEVRKKKDVKSSFPIKGDQNYIDHLDEDPERKDFRFIIATYISPEGIRGTTTRALKIRDFTGGNTKEKAYIKAKDLCEKYRTMDEGKFDTFVIEVGKFCGLRTDQYEDVNYAESELNDLVKGHKDNVEKSKKVHENRISEIKNLQKDDERTKAIKERLKNKISETGIGKNNEQKQDLKSELKNNMSKMIPSPEIESLGSGDAEVTNKVNNVKKVKKKKNNKNIQTVTTISPTNILSSNQQLSEQPIEQINMSDNIEEMEKSLKIEIDSMNKRADELNIYADKIRVVENKTEETK